MTRPNRSHLTPRPLLKTLSLRGALLCSALAVTSLPMLTGCGGGGGKDTTSAKVKAGEMPEGESWDGVYFHPLFGYLHLVKDGTNIVGRWKRADQSAWGELEGTVEGNLVRYKWTEHKVGIAGAAADTSGRGYFLYKAAKEEKGSPELDGEYGLGENESGSDWHCVKQARMSPDLDSINGDTGGLAPPAGGDWQ